MASGTASRVASGIPVSEAVDGSVPKRLEGLDQYVLAERNPDIIHDQEPNEKILDAEVARLLDGSGVLSKPIGQGTTLGRVRAQPALASSLWYGLPDINRPREHVAQVPPS